MPCLTRFSTATTTVFCILFETTVPVFVCLCFSVFSSAIGLLHLRARALSEERLDARDLAAHFADLHRVFHPSGGALEAKLEELLAKLALAGIQLVNRF